MRGLARWQCGVQIRGPVTPMGWGKPHFWKSENHTPLPDHVLPRWPLLASRYRWSPQGSQAGPGQALASSLGKEAGTGAVRRGPAGRTETHGGEQHPM